MPRACAHDVVGGALENASATSFAHAPYMQHAGNSNAHARCIEISIPKRDRHTYIHTDAKRDAKQD